MVCLVMAGLLVFLFVLMSDLRYRSDRSLRSRCCIVLIILDCMDLMNLQIFR